MEIEERKDDVARGVDERSSKIIVLKRTPILGDDTQEDEKKDVKELRLGPKGEKLLDDLQKVRWNEFIVVIVKNGRVMYFTVHTKNYLISLASFFYNSPYVQVEGERDPNNELLKAKLRVICREYLLALEDALCEGYKYDENLVKNDDIFKDPSEMDVDESDNIKEEMYVSLNSNASEEDIDVDPKLVPEKLNPSKLQIGEGSLWLCYSKLADSISDQSYSLALATLIRYAQQIEKLGKWALVYIFNTGDGLLWHEFAQRSNNEGWNYVLTNDYHRPQITSMFFLCTMHISPEKLYKIVKQQHTTPQSAETVLTRIGGEVGFSLDIQVFCQRKEELVEKKIISTIGKYDDFVMLDDSKT